MTSHPTPLFAPAPVHAVRSRGHPIAWASFVAVLIGGLWLWLYAADADKRAVERMSPHDRALFVAAECESLRVRCAGPPLAETQQCRERALLLRELAEIDEPCRALSAALTAPTR